MADKFTQILDRLKGSGGFKTDTEAASALGLTKAGLSNYKSRGSVPYEALFKYCEQHGVSSDWLLTGQEPDKRGHGGGDCPDGYAYVPLVTGEISAGGGLEADCTIDTRLAFRADWLKRKGDPRKMSLIRVRGDSMEPTLYSGDLVLVDHNKTHVEMSGGIYAIQYNHGISIKRLRLDYATRRVFIVSDNAAKYPVMEVDESGIIVNGRVIWFGRELEP